MSRHIGTRQSKLLSLGINQGYSGANILTRHRALTSFHHRNIAQAGKFIGLTLDRNAFVHTAELNGSRHFSNNRVSVGIPVGNNVTRCNLRLIPHFNRGTVGYFVALTFPTHMIKNRQFTRTRYRDQGTIGAVHHFNVVEFDHTIELT